MWAISWLHSYKVSNTRVSGSRFTTTLNISSCKACFISFSKILMYASQNQLEFQLEGRDLPPIDRHWPPILSNKWWNVMLKKMLGLSPKIIMLKAQFLIQYFIYYVMHLAKCFFENDLELPYNNFLNIILSFVECIVYNQ